jgi:BirA family transcriptional regulator, biotin operon repressor / biotin---[acetyl-CoA-carboxylase] ligase
MDTLIIGQNIIKLQSVDSTNNYAAMLLKGPKLPNGTVILTQEQTNGKGQRGNEWHALPGLNITTSIIVFPVKMNLSDQFYISMLTSLALVDLLALYRIKATIKWPNDIYVNQSKIAGILIENSVLENNLKNSIIGIGMNVNQVEFETNLYATSVAMETGETIALDGFFNDLCRCMNKRYTQLLTQQFHLIKNEYYQHLMYYQKTSSFIHNNERINATITGVDQNGRLLLTKDTGEKITTDIKEISFVI